MEQVLLPGGEGEVQVVLGFDRKACGLKQPAYFPVGEEMCVGSVQQAIICIGETPVQQVVKDGDVHDIWHAQQQQPTGFQVMMDVLQGCLGAPQMFDDIAADDAVKALPPVWPCERLDIASLYMGKAGGHFGRAFIQLYTVKLCFWQPVLDTEQGGAAGTADFQDGNLALQAVEPGNKVIAGIKGIGGIEVPFCTEMFFAVFTCVLKGSRCPGMMGVSKT